MKCMVILLSLLLSLGDAATTARWNDTFTATSIACDYPTYQWNTMEQMFYYHSNVVVYGEVIDGDMSADDVNVFCVLKNNGGGGPIPTNISVVADFSECGGFTLYPGEQYLLGLVHKHGNYFDIAKSSVYQRAIYPYSFDQYDQAVRVCGLDRPMMPRGSDFSTSGCPRGASADCYRPMPASGAIPRITPFALFLILAYLIV